MSRLSVVAVLALLALSLVEPVNAQQGAPTTGGYEGVVAVSTLSLVTMDEDVRAVFTVFSATVYGYAVTPRNWGVTSNPIHLTLYYAYELRLMLEYAPLLAPRSYALMCHFALKAANPLEGLAGEIYHEWLDNNSATVTFTALQLAKLSGEVDPIKAVYELATIPQLYKEELEGAIAEGNEGTVRMIAQTLLTTAVKAIGSLTAWALHQTGKDTLQTLRSYLVVFLVVGGGAAAAVIVAEAYVRLKIKRERVEVGEAEW